MTVRSPVRFLSLSACLLLLTVAFATWRDGSQASAADKAAATKPAADKSATDKAAATKPVADKTTADKPAAEPAHQVIAAYFHRTTRCDTCKKVGAYVDESIHSAFDSQLKDGTVKLTEIDFQDAKNQKVTKAYDITDPTLVIMDVRDGKVASWKKATKAWSLVSNKKDFSKYVQDEVKAYLDGKPKTAK
jgi:hypothetical protein